MKNPGKTLIDLVKGGMRFLPPKLLANVRVRDEKTKVDTAVTLPTMGTGFVGASLEQTVTDERLLTATFIDTTLPTTVAEQVVLSDGRIGEKTTTYSTSALSLTHNATLVDGETNKYGNLNEKIEVVAAVFTEAQYASERPPYLPSRFLTRCTTQDEAINSAGTAAAPELSTDYTALSVSSQQVKFDVVRSDSKTLVLPDSPDDTLKFVDKMLGPWGVETTSTYLLSNSSDVTPAFGTKQVQATELPNGEYQIEQTLFDTQLQMVDFKTDEETGFLIKITKTLVDATTEPTAPTKTKLVERQALDSANAIEIVSEPYIPEGGSVPASYTFADVIDVEFPDILIEVGIDWSVETSEEGAVGNVEFFDGMSVNERVSGHAMAQVSVVVAGVAWFKIQHGYRGPLKASVERVFLNAEPTDTDLGTVFKPEEVVGQLILKQTGTNKSSRVDFTSAYSLGTIAHSYQDSKGANVKVQHINFGPFLHQVSGITEVNDELKVQEVVKDFTTNTGFDDLSVSASATAHATSKLILPSSSTPPTGGSTILYRTKVTKLHMNLWMLDKYSVDVPGSWAPTLIGD